MGGNISYIRGGWGYLKGRWPKTWCRVTRCYGRREVPVEAKCPGAKVPARQGDDDDIYTPLFGERGIYPRYTPDVSVISLIYPRNIDENLQEIRKSHVFKKSSFSL